jgi:hypothetical protein
VHLSPSKDTPEDLKTHVQTAHDYYHKTAYQIDSNRKLIFYFQKILRIAKSKKLRKYRFE